MKKQRIINSHRKLIPPSTKFKNIGKEFRSFCSVYFPDATRWKKFKLALGCFNAYLFYGAWINNYFCYEFFNKSRSEKKSYLTWKKACRFLVRINGKYAHPVMREKNTFNQVFKDFVKRDWIHMSDATYDEFKEFVSTHKKFISKPSNSEGGDGVKLIEISNNDEMIKYYEENLGKKLILEEVVISCDELYELHPASLNTVRITTLFNKDKTEVSVIGSFLRVGAFNNVMDNAASGGVFADIDLEKGIVRSLAINKRGVKTETHPSTGKQIPGFKIPVWDEIVEMCKSAALLHKDIPLVGWDVAISFDKKSNKYVIQLIEGQENPNLGVHELAASTGYLERLKALGW